MSNEQLEENEENNLKKRLAHELNISLDELSELEWVIDENSSDDGLIYNYIIQFSDNSPRDILDKIPNLSDSNSIELDVNF